MWEWMKTTSPTGLVLLAWGIATGLVKFGEWKRGVERRKTPQSRSGSRDDRTQDDGAQTLTQDHMNLQLERLSRSARHDAREAINVELGRVAAELRASIEKLAERVDADEKEIRKHRDWLIEIQAALDIRRKDRT